MAEGGLVEGLLGEAEERDEDAGLGADAIAAALAMQGAQGSPEAADFLKTQKRLVELQIRHFDEERHLAIAAAKRKRFSDRLKYGLQTLGMLAAAGIIVGFGAMTWQAVNDRGVVIEPFSVPPDFAQRGLSGQVIANRLLDRLVDMGRQTNSQRAPNTYARSWGDEIKVEIPETGVSLEEVDRWLRGWLGHETRISGEITRSPTGLAMSARIAEDAGAALKGTDDDLDGMIERAAEAIYGKAEPYRYGVYLTQKNRVEEAGTFYRREAEAGSDVERAWDLNGLGLQMRLTRGPRAGIAATLRAMELGPNLGLPPGNLGMDEDDLSHPQAAFAGFAQAYRNERRPDHGGVRPDKLKLREMREQGSMAMLTGDFQTAVPLFAELTQGGPNGAAGGMDSLWIRTAVGAHDLAEARRAAATPDTTIIGAYGSDLAAAYLAVAVARIDFEAQNWEAVLADDARIAAFVRLWPKFAEMRAAEGEPLMAEALARLGRLAEAKARIGGTPLDCYDCVRARGRIAALSHDWPEAGRWFALAERQAPPIPFAYADQGEALLMKGDADGAITALMAAHKAGPRYADALKLWGDVLARQGKTRDAMAKYDQAMRYAPTWPALLAAREAISPPRG